MKKILILVSIVLLTLSATAQKKKKNAFQECYMASATSTFDLSEEKAAKLNDLVSEKLKERASTSKQIKSNEISKEEGKTKMRAINQTFFKNFADLAGKSKKEIMSFEKVTKASCNKK